MLNEQETINKMQELGFEFTSYDAWEFDSREHKFAGQIQFTTFENNFKLLGDLQKLHIKKFYMVELANGIDIRAWGMYS